MTHFPDRVENLAVMVSLTITSPHEDVRAQWVKVAKMMAAAMPEADVEQAQRRALQMVDEESDTDLAQQLSDDTTAILYHLAMVAPQQRCWDGNDLQDRVGISPKRYLAAIEELTRNGSIELRNEQTR
jgi:hypothetical protein